jgi:hypothetical protein
MRYIESVGSMISKKIALTIYPKVPVATPTKLYH